MTPAAVGQACRPGKPLEDACHNGRIDIESPAAVEYSTNKKHQIAVNQRLSVGMSPKPAKKAKARAKKSKAKPVEPDPEPDDFIVDDWEQGRRELSEIGEMKLKHLIQIFGTSAEFLDWAKGLHEIIKVWERKVKVLEREKVLVARKQVEKGVFQPVNTLFIQLLTDASQTIGHRIHAKCQSGATADDCSSYIRESLEAYISKSKTNMARTLVAIESELADAF